MTIRKNSTTPSKEKVSARSSGKSNNLEKNLGECCRGTSPCAGPSKAMQTTIPLSSKAGKALTRITVKYDVGFNNHLFIRGKGANLNWEKGQSLRNVKKDEWVWETTAPFTACEFKVLVNDIHYEVGDNHKLSCGANISYTPRF